VSSKPTPDTEVLEEPVPIEVAARKILSRQEILESDDLTTEEVDVPEWGGTVIVRALAGVERDAYESEIFTAPKVQGMAPEFNLQNLRAKLASRTMVDEDGKRLFSDKDVVALGLKSAAALDRVFSVAQRLSRLTNQDIKELTDQLVKDQSADSGSDLLES
jgi:hypothetical protein